MNARYPFDISVIIVSYNVKTYLEHLLYSLLNALEGMKWEIFVVDNCSSDGTPQFIREKFADSVCFIENDKNLGFGKANNQALAHARGEYILLINPDTIVEEKTLGLMKAFMDQNPQSGAVGCKVLNPDGTLQLACRRGFPSPLNAFFRIIGLSLLFPNNRFFSSYNMTWHDENETHPVDALSGSFMFIRHSTLEQVGFFDEAFFMYGEDLDLCYRIKQVSEIYYVPTSQIIHFKGESSKSRWWKSKIDFYRSMVIFVGKHHHSHWLRWFKPVIYVSILINAMLSLGLSFFSRHFVWLIDSASISLAYISAILFRYREWHVLPPFDNYWSYLFILTLYLAVFTFVFRLAGIYQSNQRFFLPRLTAATFFMMLVLIILSFFIKFIAFSRVVLLLFMVLTALYLISWRLVYGWKRPLRLGYLSKRRTLLIGSKEGAGPIVRQLRQSSFFEYELLGILSQSQMDIGCMIEQVPVVGDWRQLLFWVDRYNVQELITAPELIPYDDLIYITHSLRLKGIELKIIDTRERKFWGHSSPLYLGSDEDTSIPRESPLIRFHLFTKQLFDFSIGFLWLILGWPLFLYFFMKSHYQLDNIDVLGYNTNHRVRVPAGKRPIRFFAKLGYYWISSYFLITGRFSVVGIAWSDLESFSYLQIKPGIFSIARLSSLASLPLDEKRFLYHYYYSNMNLIMDLEIVMRSCARRYR